MPIAYWGVRPSIFFIRTATPFKMHEPSVRAIRLPSLRKMVDQDASPIRLPLRACPERLRPRPSSPSDSHPRHQQYRRPWLWCHPTSRPKRRRYPIPTSSHHRPFRPCNQFFCFFFFLNKANYGIWFRILVNHSILNPSLRWTRELIFMLYCTKRPRYLRHSSWHRPPSPQKHHKCQKQTSWRPQKLPPEV